ncbi:uncharacterized protein LOC100891291 [Strongylocentrotus purpuratus]|uniref:Mutator-like transposase domain-containing protein n=1 Tax=Strongylocentrotus purpuratus TaxID=7668 RepID=A0A7M7PIC4_STRPU|nr:uncharacterized protein LOC100891291 [Strongylocentrotus purpuratus]
MGRAKKGYVSKKKVFRGISRHDVKKLNIQAAAKLSEDTASKRKLISHFSPTHRVLSGGMVGHLIIHVLQLNAALEVFQDHFCQGGHLQLLEEHAKRRGLCSSLLLQCTGCKMEHRFTSSPNAVAEGAGQSAEVNKRSVLAACEVGLAREALADFCGYMDKSYQDHIYRLHLETNEVCETQMKEAGERVREVVLNANPELNSDDVLDVAVSYDGTWHRRGFVSNHGVGIVMSMDTGEVLDREVLSKICKACQSRKSWDREGEEYIKWWDDHKHSCLGNHVGSSGSMEPEAAKILWGRSVEKHRLRYKYVISDGDASTLKSIKKTYGDAGEVKKYDCIGHVGKRMFNALDKFRKDGDHSASEKKMMRKGNGHLWGTSDTGTVGRMSRLYRTTIKECQDRTVMRDEEKRARVVENMQRRVLAILYHSCKSDDNEARHQYCPDNGFCEYRNKGTMSDEDHHLDGRFLELLKPVFVRLSNKDLIERCVPGYTQNQNESFHSLIWKRCPKHLWRGPRMVALATNMAALAFNCGAVKGRNRILVRMNLEMGAHALSVASKKDKSRLCNAELKARVVTKRKREVERRAKKRAEEEYVEVEGVTYEAGAF